MNVFIIYEVPARDIDDTTQPYPRLTYGVYSSREKAKQKILRDAHVFLQRVRVDRYIIREIEVDTGKLINHYDYDVNGNPTERGDVV